MDLCYTFADSIQVAFDKSNPFIKKKGGLDKSSPYTIRIESMQKSVGLMNQAPT